MKITNLIKLVLLTLFISTLSFLYFFKNNKDSSSLKTAKVIRQNLEQRVTLSGQVITNKRLDVKPTYSSYVQQIHTKVGQKVKKGDPLVTFSSTLTGIDNTHPVRALFDGTVTQILKTVGDFVTENSEQSLVLRVDDLEDLEISAAAPELDIGKLKVGQNAKVRMTSIIGEIFEAEVSEISLSAKERERWSGSNNTEFMLKLKLKKFDSRFIPGLSAIIDILTENRDQVLTLPHEFIFERDDNYYVSLKSGEERRITLGLRNEQFAEIKSGLAEGDEIRIVDYTKVDKSSMDEM